MALVTVLLLLGIETMLGLVTIYSLLRHSIIKSTLILTSLMKPLTDSSTQRLSLAITASERLLRIKLDRPLVRQGLNFLYSVLMMIASSTTRRK